MKLERSLGILSLVTVAAGTVAGLFIVPADRLQGEVQRLLYIHVPIAWVGMLAFFFVFLMSLLYLVQRKLDWDLLALAGVEVGVLAIGLTLVLGSIWAKPTWGVWWEWDPRLVSTAILGIIYVGYLIVRSMSDDPDQRARWAAVIGVLGFVQVPVVYLSVFWWRSLHQPPSSPRSMASAFGAVMLFSFAAYTIAFAYLISRRYRLARRQLALELRGPEESP
ncbi:MAG: cytochrome c biogenesis protein CcsA [Gemmatimonadota bacterium]|nr:cytochrome c biogenesis protein CcsA [Gemmatimonadota bacterium]